MGGGTDTMRMSVSALLSAERDLDVDVVPPSTPAVTPLLPLRTDRPLGMELLCRAAAAVAGPEWARRGGIVKRTLAKRPPRPKVKKPIKPKPKKLENPDKRPDRRIDKRSEKRPPKKSHKPDKKERSPTNTHVQTLSKSHRISPLQVKSVPVEDALALMHGHASQLHTSRPDHPNGVSQVEVVSHPNARFVESRQSWAAGQFG